MTNQRVRLACPLCGESVADGNAPQPGHCPGCGARFDGDGASAPEAVGRALDALDIADVSAEELVTALFTVTPERARQIGITITSDEREGFYRWWVFLRAGADPRQVISRLLDAARA